MPEYPGRHRLRRRQRLKPSEKGNALTDVVEGEDGVARCFWSEGDPMRSYHDLEWGRPVDDDRRLFEKLTLEGFQSGLSWLTILRKRENFRRAFESFDIEAVARFDERSVARLMADAGIVRNRAKIEATVNTPADASTWWTSSGAWPATSGGSSPTPPTVRRHGLGRCCSRLAQRQRR